MIEKIAYAAPSAGGAEPSPLLSFLPLILIFVIFYFLLIRPQQKRQQTLEQLVKNLKKGDQVVTAGGILGTITSIQDDYVVLRVGDNENTKVEVLKSAISGLRQDTK